MKIAIVGYSGSGKSTLARKLSEKYNIPVLHFDTVQFLPGWEIRDQVQKEQLTKDFLDSNDSWVVDGNYSKLFYERRMEEADQIVLLLFNRFSCLLRAFRRYRKYANTSRPDMAEGCNEKYDLAFVKWILWEGRSREARARYHWILTHYGQKATVIKNQWQLDTYLKTLKSE